MNLLLLEGPAHFAGQFVKKLSNGSIPGDIERNLKPLRSVVEYAASRPSEVQVTFFVRIK